MAKFELKTEYTPQGDQPQAINELEQGLRRGDRHQVLLGVTGTFGQLTLTGAFKRASVAVIAPLDYTHMIWAVIYGYVFWGHLPGVSTWAGTAVIVSSGLFIIFREHSIKRRRMALSSTQDFQ